MPLMPALRHLSRFFLAFPLAFSLAACGSADKESPASLDGDAIAAIAPPAGVEWADEVAVTEEGGYVIGNPDAPLKLIEYASLTCGACANFAQQANEALKEKYVASGVVSWELRNQIHDPFDLTMAMLVRCGEPAGVHPLSEQVWANLESIFGTIQSNQAAVQSAMELSDQTRRYKAIADAAGLTQFFAARGISMEQSAICLANTETAERIVKQSDEQSKELQVEGTPTFFLNGQKLDAKSWAQLEPILQKAGAR